MFKNLLAMVAVLFAFPVFAADDVAALLKKADAYRLREGSARVETLVELYRGDTLDKERRYTVYMKPGRRSLVLMKSPAEAGQKVLMLADQFWLLMPDTQRPLRITATQKLLGEASTGDIANMTWSEDYDGKVVGETECPAPPASISLSLNPSPASGESVARGAKPKLAASPLPQAGEGPGERETERARRRCLHLDLSAARPGVTYARIELYLDKASKLPIKADLYVNSGKRAKEAWYEAKTVDGQLRVMSMTLQDDIQAGRRTVVRYQSIVAKEAPDEFFNPAALVRNSLAGW